MITSKSNEIFKNLLRLRQGPEIKKQQQYFLMGENLLRENKNLLLKNAIAEVRTESLPALFPELKQILFSTDLFRELDAIGTHFNLVLMSRPSLKSYDTLSPPQGMELIVPLGDPTNLGALIRSAVALGASKILLTPQAAEPFHPKAIKASAGAILRAPLQTVTHLSELETYALDLQGESLLKFHWPKNMRLLVGEEGPGLSRLQLSSKTKFLQIPIAQVESLNATVAASIALYEYKKMNG